MLINGRRILANLDTHASVSVIDASVASQLELKVQSVSGLLHLAAAGTSTPRLGVVQAELKLGTTKVKSTQTSVELMNLSNGVAMLLGLTDMINLGLTVSNLPSGFSEPSSVRSVESKNRRDNLGEAPVVKNPADPLLRSTAPKAMYVMKS